MSGRIPRALVLGEALLIAQCKLNCIFIMIGSTWSGHANGAVCMEKNDIHSNQGIVN